jgi:hypothetical protein
MMFVLYAQRNERGYREDVISQGVSRFYLNWQECVQVCFFKPPPPTKPRQQKPDAFNIVMNSIQVSHTDTSDLIKTAVHAHSTFLFPLLSELTAVSTMDPDLADILGALVPGVAEVSVDARKMGRCFTGLFKLAESLKVGWVGYSVRNAIATFSDSVFDVASYELNNTQEAVVNNFLESVRLGVGQKRTSPFRSPSRPFTAGPSVTASFSKAMAGHPTVSYLSQSKFCPQWMWTT